MSTESVMPPNHLILCHPLLLPPSVFPSIRVSSSESVLLTRWPKCWSFSSSISPSSEYSGLISFRMDWLDLLAVHGTLKSLLPTPQFRSINSSVLGFLFGLAVSFLEVCLIELSARVLSLQSSRTLCDPTDRGLPGSSVHGLLHTGVACGALLQGIFPTQESKLCLLQLLY